jgi:hypothetical protein
VPRGGIKLNLSEHGACDIRALRARGVLLVAGGFGYTFNITNVNSSANKITSPTNRSLVVVLD